MQHIRRFKPVNQDLFHSYILVQCPTILAQYPPPYWYNAPPYWCNALHHTGTMPLLHPNRLAQIITFNPANPLSAPK